MNRCGKLVVAEDCSEHPALNELLRGGKSKKIDLQAITEEEAKAIEPRVKTLQQALFFPATSTVDSTKVLQSMTSDALNEGGSSSLGVQDLKKTQEGIFTSTGTFKVGYLINAAGLYADKIAKDFGFSENY